MTECCRAWDPAP